MEISSVPFCTSTISSQCTIKNPEWYYYKLEIQIDPSITLDSNSVQLDAVSWKSIILSALKKLHGTIGESMHFDLLQVKNLEALIRTPSEDSEKFHLSMSGFSSNLKKVVQIDVNYILKVVVSSQYLIGVNGPKRL